MLRGLTLDEKLDLLITQAADDQDGTGGSSASASVVPPRLRHARQAGDSVR